MAHRGIVTIVLLLGLLLAVPAAFAAPGNHLKWGAELHSGDSACPPGTLVVNVVQKVTNDADSGFGGAWAFDDYVRHIQIVQTGSNTFCATVSYEGSFTTIAGPSPSDQASVEAGVVGTFQGGYVSTVFTATPRTSDTRTRGSIGTYDYACDASFNCPGYVDWTNLYFSSVSGFDLVWWGWIYRAGSNGTWVNAIGGSSGDITGD